VVSDGTVDPPTIWRTKLRSLKPGVDHAKQVAYCIDGGRVGIGWGMEGLPSGASLTDVVAAIRSNPERGWGPQAASTVRLFGQEAEVGDFIWTRDLEGRFRLARITGEYHYDNSAGASEVDIHQVRQAEWAQRPLGDLEVPGAIIRAFSGTSTSFSRMWNRGARIYTTWIWEKLHGRKPRPLGFSPAEVLQQLEPYDLEDLIYTWMQALGGYLALPKARRTDTPAYEWTMLHRETHTPAIVQVKSGGQGVDLEALASAAPDQDTILFAYSAAGIYTGSPPREVTCIDTSDLLAFVDEHPKLLPPRVRTWFEVSHPPSR
jgi:hypothetical protein